MKKPNQSSGSSPVTPDAVSSASTPAYSPGGDHSFTLQTIMEMQKSLGQLAAVVEGLKGSIDGVKTKVEDLVKWKAMIFGGVIVLSVMISFGVFLVTKFGDYITIKSPVAAPTVIAPAAPSAGPKKGP